MKLRNYLCPDATAGVREGVLGVKGIYLDLGRAALSRGQAADTLRGLAACGLRLKRPIGVRLCVEGEGR